MKMRIVVLLLILSSVLPLAAATVTYTYDNAGRVIRVDYGNGKGYVYTYDANGNLLRRTALSATGGGKRRSVRH